MHWRICFGDSRIIFVLIFLLPLFAPGCTQIGTTVAVDERVPFGMSGESVQGVYNDGILKVDYRYRLTGSKLNIAGQIDLAFRWESLDVYVLFIDGQGEVLDQKNIYSSGNAISLVKSKGTSFDVNLQIPAESTGISFSYSYMPYRGHR